MKIGILTHYNVYNLGAQLQMYAMKYWLEEHGHEVYILTYEKNYDFDRDEEKKNSGSLQNVLYYMHEYMIKKGVDLTVFNSRKVIAIKRDFCQMKTVPYNESGCDAIIIGSDEVFSIDVGCNRMMYGYGIGNIPLIAYAPSFGRTTEEILKRYECYDLVKIGLENNITRLSARDHHTKEIILSMTGMDVPLVCDPVILYRGNRFRVPVRKMHRRYMLLYSYDRNFTDKEEIREVRDYARKKGLVTVSLGTYHGWCDKNVACNAHQWFSFFRGAETVLTDTFHGSVVAIKNHCNVAVYIRKSINSFKMESLLQETGLRGRELKAITNENLEKVFSEKIDYRLVDQRIRTMQHKGESFLLQSLESL